MPPPDLPVPLAPPAGTPNHDRRSQPRPCHGGAMIPRPAPRSPAAAPRPLTMQLLKRGLRATAMRGVRPLAPGQGRVVGEAYTVRFIPCARPLGPGGARVAGQSAAQRDRGVPAGGDSLHGRARQRGGRDARRHPRGATPGARGGSLRHRQRDPRRRGGGGDGLPGVVPGACRAAPHHRLAMGDRQVPMAAAGWRWSPATCWSATGTGSW